MVEAERIAAEAAFRRLACGYARSMDRNLPELLDDVLTADVVIDGPGFRISDLAGARAAPGTLKTMFSQTTHVVHNQTLLLTGADEAEGETYCTAAHISLPAEGEPLSAWVWAIRYQDRMRREGGTWKLSYRQLIVDWTDRRPVELMPVASI